MPKLAAIGPGRAFEARIISNCCPSSPSLCHCIGDARRFDDPQVGRVESAPSYAAHDGLRTCPASLLISCLRSACSDWTPNSQAVLFSSNRNGTYKIFRQGIDQVVPEVLVEGHSLFSPRVSPNGKEILHLAGYNPQTPAQPVSAMAVFLAGGPSRVVLQMPVIETFQCSRNPSKLCLFATTERVFSFDPEDGNAAAL